MSFVAPQNRLDQNSLLTMLAGDLGERDNITSQCSAGKGASRPDISFRPDPALGTKSLLHFTRIGAANLAKTSDLVGECNG